MAITIASKSSSGWVSGTSVSVTKPSGLAEGDLMLAKLAAFSDSTSGFDTPSGWTLVNSIEGDDARLYIFAKVADASDVAASSFTFNPSTANDRSRVGFIFRITGAGHISRITSDVLEVDVAANQSFVPVPSVTPNYNDSLYLMSALFSRSGLNFSGYAITTDNPSWSEEYDVSDGVTALATASASRNAKTATGSGTINHNIGTGRMVGVTSLVVVGPVVNASLSPAAISLTSAVGMPSLEDSEELSPDAVGLSIIVPSPTIQVQNNAWSNLPKS